MKAQHLKTPVIQSIRLSLITLFLCFFTATCMGATSTSSNPTSEMPKLLDLYAFTDDGDHSFWLCSGIRDSHEKLLMSNTCFDTLNSNAKDGLLIYVVDATGVNQGLVTMDSLKLYSTTNNGVAEPGLALVTFTPYSKEILSRSDHYKNELKAGSQLTVLPEAVHSNGQRVKRSASLAECTNEACIINHDEHSSSSYVFYDQQLLCINDKGHCIRPRSLDDVSTTTSSNTKKRVTPEQLAGGIFGTIASIIFLYFSSRIIYEYIRYCGRQRFPPVTENLLLQDL